MLLLWTKETPPRSTVSDLHAGRSAGRAGIRDWDSAGTHASLNTATEYSYTKHYQVVNW